MRPGEVDISDTSICADYAWATHGPNAELRVHATLKGAGFLPLLFFLPGIGAAGAVGRGVSVGAQEAPMPA